MSQPLDDIDATIADFEPEVGPVLRFDDGTDLVLDGPVALGRNPVPPSTHPGARLVALDDPAKRISKTHLLIEFTDGLVDVTDLGSTNGVRLEELGTEVRRLDPHQPTQAGIGVKVHFGGRWFEVLE